MRPYDDGEEGNGMRMLIVFATATDDGGGVDAEDDESGQSHPGGREKAVRPRNCVRRALLRRAGFGVAAAPRGVAPGQPGHGCGLCPASELWVQFSGGRSSASSLAPL